MANLDSTPRRAPVDDADDVLVKRVAPTPRAEPDRRERGLDTMRLADLDGRIAAAVAADREQEHEGLRELLVHLVIEPCSEVDPSIAKLESMGAARATKLVGVVEQLHALRVQFADLQGDLATLREHKAGGDCAPHGLRINSEKGSRDAWGVILCI